LCGGSQRPQTGSIVIEWRRHWAEDGSVEFVWDIRMDDPPVLDDDSVSQLLAEIAERL
jgi:hypothetical protein